jgi:hypothetical protein
MYENGKMNHAEAIPGMIGGGSRTTMERKFNYDVLQEVL